MMREPRRSAPGFTGSPLVRQLARLTQVEAPESKQAFAERLGQWLGWTDAISLSAALGTPAASAGRSAETGPAAEADATRLRAVLVKGLADSAGTAPTRGRAHPRGPTPLPAPAADDMPTGDFSPHRRHYHARQQAMDAAVGPLRARLRGALAARSPALARLAAVDAVMEQALAERERSLLSVVPVLLEKRFEQLRQAHAATAGDGSAAPSGAWITVFRQDMQRLLLAELDHRWQPIDGLLAALRDGPPSPGPWPTPTP